MKSGNLNFLEPSGPLKACNGTVLPLSLHVLSSVLHSQFVLVSVCYIFRYVVHEQRNINTVDNFSVGC